MEQPIETNTNQTESQEAITPVILSNIPIVAKIIAVLFYLVSVVLIFGGIIAAFVSTFTLSYLGVFGITSGLVPGLTTLAWGVLSFYTGRGLWQGKQWGRILAIVMGCLYIIYAVLIVVLLEEINYIFPIINLVIVLYLIFSRKVSMAFQKGGSTTAILVPSILAIIIYVVMVYPNFIPKQSSFDEFSQSLRQLQQTQNNNPPIPSPQQTEPNVKGEVYSNSDYNFQLTLTVPYMVHDYSSEDGIGHFIFASPTNSWFFGVNIFPANNQSLDILVDNELANWLQPYNLEKGEINGISMIHATKPAALFNWYFVVWKDKFYEISKASGFTDKQFEDHINTLILD